jgi:hypothetical protein
VFRDGADRAPWVTAVDERLRELKETWAYVEGAAVPRHLVCVCGEGLRTQVRIVVDKGRVRLPGEGQLSALPADAVTDGDGTVTLESAIAWTGATPHIIRIPVGRHRDMIRATPAFAAILQGLR